MYTENYLVRGLMIYFEIGNVHVRILYEEHVSTLHYYVRVGQIHLLDINT